MILEECFHKAETEFLKVNLICRSTKFGLTCNPECLVVKLFTE